ncbi:tetratricopeptide repeat protein [Chryseobacterium sp. PBS4-4]|uniref:Tetratricopeptide repeat protein n=1 Tax=Chryseobacterium edaphi TaxID=2976532 RepID=A0ABT2W0T5_9FLAO|nr:tetratricopeptide repeat protein [Chryseobacterium edaphi]MCU7615847.1 tetratricopeptide repeat protein [Chryseobacterium edaphi]
MLLKNNNRDEEYGILLKAVKNKVFHFIVVQYNHYNLVREAQTLLQQTYPKKKTQKINLLEESTENLISQLLKDNSDVYFIENFQVLFQDENQSVAIGINQRRDKLSQKKGQIIAFLPNGNAFLRNFQKKMPDLSSITSIIIQLEEEQLKSTDLHSNLSLVTQNDDYDNIPDAETEIRRIEKRLNTLSNKSENNNLRIQLISDLAKAYRFTGQYIEAKKRLEDLKKYVESLSSESREVVINDICSDLALVLKDLGDYQQAKIYLEKALNSSIKNFGEEHPTTTISYSNLATVLQNLGDYQQAKIYLEKALDFNIKSFGEKHSNTAISYSNLATVLKDLRDYPQAKIYLEKALDSNIKNYGEEHPNTAISYSNLATVLQNLRDYTQAKIYLEKALYSNIKNFGEGHPITAISYSNLATVLQNLGDYQQAETFLKKALDSNIKNFGEEHSTTAIRYANLASVLQDLTEYQKARAYFEKALDIFVKSLGQGHPNTEITKKNLDYLNDAISKIKNDHPNPKK